MTEEAPHLACPRLLRPDVSRAEKIKREGTMPHWYARASLDEIRRTLDVFLKEALARE